MPARRSSALLLYRRNPAGIEVLLGHPGGPFYTRRDDGVWSIPKGEYDAAEDPLTAARREFAEETGHRAPDGPVAELGEVRYSSGKRVIGFAVEGDLDPETVASNLFELVWPPRSGRVQQFPEIDRAAWFTPEQARQKILPAQWPLIERLLTLLR